MSPEERHHIASAYERGMAVLAEERARRDDSRTLPAPSDAPIEMPLTAPRLPRITVRPEQHPPISNYAAAWTEWEFRSVSGNEVRRVIRRSEPNDRSVQHEYQRVIRQWIGSRGDQ